jgi:hypothetical protein
LSGGSIPVLTDATVVSDFAAAERLDLVRDVLTTVYMTHTVYEELLRGVEKGFSFLSMERMKEELVDRGIESRLGPATVEGARAELAAIKRLRNARAD